MLGHTRHGAVQPLQGDATLNFNLDDMTIDVVFTKVMNLTTRDDFPDLRFDDVPVSSGTFTNRTDTAHIAGRSTDPLTKRSEACSRTPRRWERSAAGQNSGPRIGLRTFGAKRQAR